MSEMKVETPMNHVKLKNKVQTLKSKSIAEIADKTIHGNAQKKVKMDFTKVSCPGVRQRSIDVYVRNSDSTKTGGPILKVS